MSHGVGVVFVIKVMSLDKEEVYDFLDSIPWGKNQQSHDLATHRGKIEAYIISLYVTTMTLTTVGYGDISALNSNERYPPLSLSLPFPLHP